MNKNRFQKRQFLTHDPNTVYFNSTVLEIVEKNKECANGKFKNVFKCAHPEKKEGITCILWERNCLDVGDKIKMEGKFKDEIFIAYSAMVHRHCDSEARGNPEKG